MDITQKRDIIRFVGEALTAQYKRGLLHIAPTYDTTYINEDTDIINILQEFFVSPYEDLIKYRNTLKDNPVQLFMFNSKYPALEDEMLEVVQLVNGAVRQYAEIVAQAEAEKKMLGAMTIDTTKLRNIKKLLEQLGPVKRADG